MFLTNDTDTNKSVWQAKFANFSKAKGTPGDPKSIGQVKFPHQKLAYCFKRPIADGWEK